MGGSARMRRGGLTHRGGAVSFRFLSRGLAARQDTGVRDVAQPGSAPEWGSGGRRFKSGRPDYRKRRPCNEFVAGPSLFSTRSSDPWSSHTSTPLRRMPDPAHARRPAQHRPSPWFADRRAVRPLHRPGGTCQALTRCSYFQAHQPFVLGLVSSTPKTRVRSICIAEQASEIRMRTWRRAGLRRHFACTKTTDSRPSLTRSRA